MIVHPVSVALLRDSLMCDSVFNGPIISFYNMFGMLGLVHVSLPGISSALFPMVLPMLLMFMITLMFFIGW
jgi:hypothetical protein